MGKHTMLLIGQQTAEAYGRLYSRDEYPEAYEWFISEVGLQPGHGLLVLEIQSRILYFLVYCCRQLLHDLPSKSLTGEDIPVQPEPAFLFNDELRYPSLPALASEAPYRVPAHLDFTRLQSLINTKLAEVEDHIWALQEDPGYFAEAMLD
jgi:hypothetical protein